jgi:hypothetical protein
MLHPWHFNHLGDVARDESQSHRRFERFVQRRVRVMNRRAGEARGEQRGVDRLSAGLLAP